MFKTISICLLALPITACLNSQDDTSSEVLSKYNMNSFSMNKLVCDPFQDTTPTAESGLKASLYTMADGSHPSSLDPFYSTGVKSDKELYFSEINVPTRIFSMGFPTETEKMVKADDGSDLVEWFALRLNSTLKLAPEDAEGDYELALLADDGARLSIKDENGNYVVAVDNDGLHPTRMGCGSVITMTKDTRLSVQIDYFQGPRWHISVIPMWRKVNNSTLAETQCGQQGNNLFFDFNNNSSQQPAYNELLSRDWMPIAASNWEIEGNDSDNFNPCTEGDALNISELSIQTIENFIIVTWTTDRPATSQAMFKNTTTDEEFTSISDNILRTEHRVTLVISDRTEPYEITAISIADDLGKTMSEPITLP